MIWRLVKMYLLAVAVLLTGVGVIVYRKADFLTATHAISLSCSCLTTGFAGGYAVATLSRRRTEP